MPRVRLVLCLLVPTFAMGSAAAGPTSFTRPSQRLKPYAGNGFEASVPDNWVADPRPSGTVYFAAPGDALVRRAADGGTVTSIAMGMSASVTRTLHGSAGQAADALLRDLREENPDLEVRGREPTTLEGAQAELLVVDGPSLIRGKRERNWILVAVRQGQQLMAALTCPLPEADELSALLGRILLSLGVPSWRGAGAGPTPGAVGTRAGASTALRPYSSQKPPFLLYKPESWRVRAAESGGALRITVSDPEGTSLAESVFAPNPGGRHSSLTLLVARMQELARDHGDLAVSDVHVCRDEALSCAVATVAYTVQGTRVTGRTYCHADPAMVTIRSVSAPTARFAAGRSLLLDVLANIHVRGSAPPLVVRLVDRQAPDRSLSLGLPADWQFLAQKGTVVATAPGGRAGFIFTVFTVMPGSAGVAPPPGVLVSPYRSPPDFLPVVFSAFRNREIRVLGATPDPRLASQCPARLGRSCEAADVQASWTSPEGARCTGSFKLLDARPNLAGQWFSVVAGIWGPSEDLSRHLPMLEHIAGSFRIDDAYAKGYIQNGLTHLRELQRKTQTAMQGLYDAIGQNQSDYESRVARKEAADARRDDYARGNTYWISDLEGGKVYATDPWGTQDTRTGDRHEGAPNDYIHFEGQNPVYRSEQMREVSSYELKQLGYE